MRNKIGRKMKRVKYNLILASIFLLTSFSCDTTEPPIDNIPPGRRDYVWTVDTLGKITPNDYTELWGEDPNDLWIAGDSWDLDKNVMHFDGVVWTKVQTIPAPVEAWSLYGIDRNNIWIGGVNADFWKFNGQTFELFNKYPIKGFLLVTIIDIWGNVPNNIFACGGATKESNQELYTVLLKYNGTEWKYIIEPNNKGSLLKIRGDNNGLYIFGDLEIPYESDLVSIYEYKNNKMELIHSNENDPSDFPFLERVGEKVFFGWEKKMYYKENNEVKLFKDFSNTIKAENSFYGRNTNDLFFEADGGLGHYNGKDTKILYPIEKRFFIVKALFFSKDVIFLFYTYNDFAFYILRGKLK